jgi:hypothetical protein|tara:strand:+ start:578 stop:1213 length:636 start_codon:yes stop_codon:yes gene_type:complete
MIIDTIGGVSPLKARQSSRGGKRAGQATSTSRRRGGFAKSTGKRGAGGRNVGGYNVKTRFTPSVIRPFPSSGGTTTISKPYSYDKEGKLQMSGADADASADAKAGTPAEGYWKRTGTELPSYKRAWDKDLEGITKKYSSFEDYVADIEDQKKMAETEDWEGIAKKRGITVERAKEIFERRKDKHGQWRWVETKAATKGSSSASASASASTK